MNRKWTENTQYTYLYMWTYFVSYRYLLQLIWTLILQFLTIDIALLHGRQGLRGSRADHVTHGRHLQNCIMDMGASSLILPQWASLQLKLVCYFGCNVLKGDRSPWYPLEADSIEWQPRQLADLHLPLHQAVLPCVAMHAEEQEPLLLFVVTVICVQHFADFSHHVIGIHRAGGLHAPREPQGPRLGVFAVFLLALSRLPGCTSGRRGWRDRRKEKFHSGKKSHAHRYARLCFSAW